MNDYPYPADEFDQTDEPAAGSQSAGIHRAPRSRWSRVWPFLAVLVIFAALATGLYLWFSSQSPSTPSAPGTTAAATTTAPPAAETTPPEEPETPTAEESEPTATDEETGEETEEPAEPQIDRKITVRVLNATSIQGLAAGAVTDIKGLGFTDVSGDNYKGDAVSSSQVWYQGPEDKAAAQEIAAKLGIATVTEVDTLVGPVSVILAADFAS